MAQSVDNADADGKDISNPSASDETWQKVELRFVDLAVNNHPVILLCYLPRNWVNLGGAMTEHVETACWAIKWFGVDIFPRGPVLNNLFTGLQMYGIISYIIPEFFASDSPRIVTKEDQLIVSIPNRTTATSFLNVVLAMWKTMRQKHEVSLIDNPATHPVDLSHFPHFTEEMKNAVLYCASHVSKTQVEIFRQELTPTAPAQQADKVQQLLHAIERYQFSPERLAEMRQIDNTSALRCLMVALYVKIMEYKKKVSTTEKRYRNTKQEHKNADRMSNYYQKKRDQTREKGKQYLVSSLIAAQVLREILKRHRKDDVITRCLIDFLEINPKFMDDIINDPMIRPMLEKSWKMTVEGQSKSSRLHLFKLFVSIPLQGGTYRSNDRIARTLWQTIPLKVVEIDDTNGQKDFILERTSHRRIPVQEQIGNVANKVGRSFTTRIRKWIFQHLPAFYTHGFNANAFHGIEYRSNNAQALAQYPAMRCMHVLSAFINDPMLMTYLQPQFVQELTSFIQTYGIPLEYNTEQFRRLYGRTVGEILSTLDEISEKNTENSDQTLYEQCVTSFESYLADPDQLIETQAEEFEQICAQNVADRSTWLEKSGREKKLDDDGDVIMKETTDSKKGAIIVEPTIVAKTNITKQQWMELNDRIKKTWRFVEAEQMNFEQFLKKIRGDYRMKVTMDGLIPRILGYARPYQSLKELVLRCAGFEQVLEMDSNSIISVAAQALLPKIEVPVKLCAKTDKCFHLENGIKHIIQNGNVGMLFSCTKQHVAQHMFGDLDLSNDLKSMKQLLKRFFRVGIEPCCGNVLQNTQALKVGDILGPLQGKIVTMDEQLQQNAMYKLQGKLLKPCVMRMNCHKDMKMDCTIMASILRWMYPRCEHQDSTIDFIDWFNFETLSLGKLAMVMKEVPEDHCLTALRDGNVLLVDGKPHPYDDLCCYGLCAHCCGSRDYAAASALFDSGFDKHRGVPGFVNTHDFTPESLKERIMNDTHWLYPGQFYTNVAFDNDDQVGNGQDEKDTDGDVNMPDTNPNSSSSPSNQLQGNWNKRHRAGVLSCGLKEEVLAWRAELERKNPEAYACTSVDEHEWTSAQRENAKQFREIYDSILAQRDPAAQQHAVVYILNAEVAKLFEPFGDLNTVFSPFGNSVWDRATHFDHFTVAEEEKANSWLRACELLEIEIIQSIKAQENERDAKLQEWQAGIRLQADQALAGDDEMKQLQADLHQLEDEENQFEEEAKRKLHEAAKAWGKKNDNRRWTNVERPKMLKDQHTERIQKQQQWEPEKGRLRELMAAKLQPTMQEMENQEEVIKKRAEIVSNFTTKLEELAKVNEHKRKTLNGTKPRLPKNDPKEVIIYRKIVTLCPQTGSLDSKFLMHTRKRAVGAFIDHDDEKGAASAHCGIGVPTDAFRIKSRAESSADNFCTFNAKLLPLKPSLSQLSPPSKNQYIMTICTFCCNRKPIVSFGLGLLGKVDAAEIVNTDLDVDTNFFFDENPFFSSNSVQKIEHLRNRDGWGQYYHATKNYVQKSKLAIYHQESGKVLPLQFHMMAITDAAGIKELCGYQTDTDRDEYFQVCNMYQGKMDDFIEPASMYSENFPLQRVMANDWKDMNDVFHFCSYEETRKCVQDGEEKYVLLEGLPGIYYHADGINFSPGITCFLMTNTPDSMTFQRETLKSEVFPRRFGSSWEVEMTVEEAFRMCNFPLRDVPWTDLSIINQYRDLLHSTQGYANTVFNSDFQSIINITPHTLVDELERLITQMFNDVNLGLQKDFPDIFSKQTTVFHQTEQHCLSYIGSLTKTLQTGKAPNLFRAEFQGDPARCWLIGAPYATKKLVEHVLNIKLSTARFSARNRYTNLDKQLLLHIVNAFAARLFRFLLAVLWKFYQLPIDVQESESTRKFLVSLHHSLNYLNRISTSSFPRTSTLYRFMSAYIPAFLMSRRDLHPSVTDSRHAEKGNQNNKHAIVYQTNNQRKHQVDEKKCSPCQMAQVEQITLASFLLANLRSVDFSHKAKTSGDVTHMVRPGEDWHTFQDMKPTKLMDEVLQCGSLKETLISHDHQNVVEWAQLIASGVEAAGQQRIPKRDMYCPPGKEDIRDSLVESIGKPILSVLKKPTKKKKSSNFTRKKKKSFRNLFGVGDDTEQQNKDDDEKMTSSRIMASELTLGESAGLTDLARIIYRLENDERKKNVNEDDDDDDEDEEEDEKDQVIPTVMSMDAPAIIPIDADFETILFLDEAASMQQDEDSLKWREWWNRMIQQEMKQNADQDGDDAEKPLDYPDLTQDLLHSLHNYAHDPLNLETRCELTEKFQAQQKPVSNQSLDVMIDDLIDKVQSANDIEEYKQSLEHEWEQERHQLHDYLQQEMKHDEEMHVEHPVALGLSSQVETSSVAPLATTTALESVVTTTTTSSPHNMMLGMESSIEQPSSNSFRFEQEKSSEIGKRGRADFEQGQQEIQNEEIAPEEPNDDDLDTSGLPPPHKKFKTPSGAATPSKVMPNAPPEYHNPEWFGTPYLVTGRLTYAKAQQRVESQTQPMQKIAWQAAEHDRYLSPTTNSPKWQQTVATSLLQYMRILEFLRNPDVPQEVYQQWVQHENKMYQHPWMLKNDEHMKTWDRYQKKLEKQKNSSIGKVNKRGSKPPDRYVVLYEDFPTVLLTWKKADILQFPIAKKQLNLWCMGARKDNKMSKIEVRKPTDIFIPYKFGDKEGEFWLISLPWLACPMLYDPETRCIQWPRDAQSLGRPFHMFVNNDEGRAAFKTLSETETIINMDYDRVNVSVDLETTDLSTPNPRIMMGSWLGIRYLKRMRRGLWQTPLNPRLKYTRDTAIMAYVMKQREHVFKTIANKTNKNRNRHLDIPFAEDLPKCWVFPDDVTRLESKKDESEDEVISPESPEIEEQEEKPKSKKKKGKKADKATVNETEISDDEENAVIGLSPVRRSKRIQERKKAMEKSIGARSDSKSQKTKKKKSPPKSTAKTSRKAQSTSARSSKSKSQTKKKGQKDDDKAESVETPESQDVTNLRKQKKFLQLTCNFVMRVKHLTDYRFNKLVSASDTDNILQVTNTIFNCDTYRDWVPSASEDESDNDFSLMFPVTTLAAKESPKDRYQKLPEEYPDVFEKIEAHQQQQQELEKNTDDEFNIDDLDLSMDFDYMFETEQDPPNEEEGKNETLPEQRTPGLLTQALALPPFQENLIDDADGDIEVLDAAGKKEGEEEDDDDGVFDV